MTAHRRPGGLANGTPVTHSMTGWAGVIVGFWALGSPGASYRVRWDKNGHVGSVSPRFVVPGFDVHPASGEPISRRSGSVDIVSVLWAGDERSLGRPLPDLRRGHRSPVRGLHPPAAVDCLPGPQGGSAPDT